MATHFSPMCVAHLPTPNLSVSDVYIKAQGHDETDQNQDPIKDFRWIHHYRKLRKAKETKHPRPNQRF